MSTFPKKKLYKIDYVFMSIYFYLCTEMIVEA